MRSSDEGDNGNRAGFQPAPTQPKRMPLGEALEVFFEDELLALGLELAGGALVDGALFFVEDAEVDLFFGGGEAYGLAEVVAIPALGDVGHVLVVVVVGVEELGAGDRKSVV